MRKSPQNQQKQNQSNLNIQKLQLLKSSLFKVLHLTGNHKNYDAKYRRKTIKYYEQKSKKVFYPHSMQNYNEIKNFQDIFDDYMQEYHKNSNLNENNQAYIDQTLAENSKKDIFQNLLTLDIDKIAKLATFKFAQIENQSNKNQTNNQIRLFPMIHNKNILKKNYEKQSPIIFSSEYRSLDSHKLKNTIKRNNTDRSLINSLFSRKNSPKNIKSNKNFVYSPENIIQKLNQLNKSKFTINNFEITKQDFKKILIERHGNQILTSYFGLPQKMSLNYIVEVLNQFNFLALRQKLMIAFLTYDLNKDGFICQNDMFNLSKKVTIDSAVHEDIHKIMKFVKENGNNGFSANNDIELPEQLILSPKRKIYQRFFGDSQSINCDCSNKSSQKNFNLINSKLKQKKLQIQKTQTQKKIKINLQNFKRIFLMNECSLIFDIEHFLLQKTNQNEQKQLIRTSNKKIKKQIIDSSSISNRFKTLDLRNSNKSIKDKYQIHKGIEKVKRFYTEKSIQKSLGKFTTLQTEPQSSQNSRLKLYFKSNKDYLNQPEKNSYRFRNQQVQRIKVRYRNDNEILSEAHSFLKKLQK